MKAAATLILFALIVGSAQAAGDIATGERKSQPCHACHGKDGNGTGPQFPRLAGQYPDYLVQALQAYKSGGRKNPIMAPFAASLSLRDMEDLAAYYASRPNGLVFVPIGR